MFKETVLSIDDLRYLFINCKNCNSQVIFDLAAKFEARGERESNTPVVCPSCRFDFDSAIQPNIDKFRVIFQQLSAVPKDAIGFRVKHPVESLPE